MIKSKKRKKDCFFYLLIQLSNLPTFSLCVQVQNKEKAFQALYTYTHSKVFIIFKEEKHNPKRLLLFLLYYATQQLNNICFLLLLFEDSLCVLSFFHFKSERKKSRENCKLHFISQTYRIIQTKNEEHVVIINVEQELKPSLIFFFF